MVNQNAEELIREVSDGSAAQEILDEPIYPEEKRILKQRAGKRFIKKSKFLRKKIPKKILKKRLGGGTLAARLRKFAAQKKIQRQQR